MNRFAVALVPAFTLPLVAAQPAVAGEPDACLYRYRAIVNEVYDGDTITSADVDLGMHVWLKDQRFRLYGIDTPELRGVDDPAPGLAARDYLRDRILGREVIIQTRKDETGKYGRWIATIWVDGKNVNDELVDEGLAVRRWE